MSSSKSSIQTEVSRVEYIAYAVQSFSRSLLSTLPAYYLLYFYTDILFLPAGALTILVFLKDLWDGVNDEILAYCMGNTRSRHGRFRSYILWAAIPTSVFTVLLFIAPDLPVMYKLIYSYIVYFIWDFLASMQKVAANSLLPVMTKNSSQRTLFNSCHVAFSIIAVMIISSFALQMVDFFGKGDQKIGFAMLALVIGFIAAPMQLFAFKNLKERHDQQQEEKLSILKALRCIFSDRSLLLVLAMFLTYWTATVFKNQITIYYFKYVIEQPEKVSVFFLVGTASSFSAQFIIRRVSDKLNINRSVALGLIGSIAGMLTIAAAGHNLPFIYIGNFIFGISSAFPANLIYIIMAEFVDKLNMKYHFNFSSWVYSTLNLSTKLSSGIGGSLFTFTLYLTHYSAEKPISAEGVSAIRLSFLGGSIIALVLALLIMSAYIMRKNKEAL